MHDPLHLMYVHALLCNVLRDEIANNNVKLHCFCHNFDSYLYKVVCIHAGGEVDNFYDSLLSNDR